MAASSWPSRLNIVSLDDDFLGNGVISHMCVCACNTIACSKVVVSGFVYNHFMYQLIRMFIIWTKARLVNCRLIYNHVKHFIDFKVT